MNEVQIPLWSGINPLAVARFWAKVSKSDEPDGCWLWTGHVGANGYGVFWINGTNASAHRVAYEIAFGPIPEGLVVCHRCDVRTCVKPLHLFSGTYADNEHDKMAKGRSAVGERQGHAQLTEGNVRAIRSMAGARSQRAIARMFGISQTTVRDVISGRTWRHVA